jgi:hypothetical protein
MDTQFNTAALGFDDCITRDGQSPATANIPMGGFKITGLAAPASPGDAASYGPSGGGKPVNRFTNFTNTTSLTTSSSTAVMGGYGSSWTLTPSTTGSVRVRVTGDMSQTNAGSSADLRVYYGTGTAPTRGAAVTGTPGTTSEYTLSGVAATVPFATEFEVKGLTLATAYWFDLAFRTPGGTSGSAAPISVIIEEF